MAGTGNKVYSVSRLQLHPLLNSIYHLHIPHYTYPPLYTLLTPSPPPAKKMHKRIAVVPIEDNAYSICIF